MKSFITLLLVILLGFAGFMGYEYYQSVYASQTVYAKAPSNIPEANDVLDDSGKKIVGLKGYSYILKFVTKEGKIENRHVLISGEADEVKPLVPNSYVEAKISQKRVTEGPNGVKESEIPANVLAKLK
ncbi:hypothetical protein WOSG25_080490 [Weissella oryzae SG25]|uniref:YxeA family protein n=1 Tax=Weissella oryzae (strain DSM 25784 / JCM 18191 / LMG 30913 / SG25) TaxID=1329250 RepID=A0A069CUZ6_WEIOS|nr:DUF1093 domain-containing protein [Weissella oryzae]GAK31217.1 hypothetical protein WOSG25_080490 [Weissella oryzae SG25]